MTIHRNQRKKANELGKAQRKAAFEIRRISLHEADETPEDELSSAVASIDRSSTSSAQAAPTLGRFLRDHLDPQFDVQQFEKRHAFKVHNYMGLPFCDFCGNFMWGIMGQGVKCEGKFDSGFAFTWKRTNNKLYLFFLSLFFVAQTVDSMHTNDALKRCRTIVVPIWSMYNVFSASTSRPSWKRTTLLDHLWSKFASKKLNSVDWTRKDCIECRASWTMLKGSKIAWKVIGRMRIKCCANRTTCTWSPACWNSIFDFYRFRWSLSMRIHIWCKAWVSTAQPISSSL